ncbi:MAG: 1-deoxy-D-xylulose-5-phosphate synthase, partial [Treponema sp.]|nr:1-deoxy-D-xylulose-5-phosphate synthase [Treponema sp.]
GIAEEHAVTFAAALAAQGIKPVAAIYSTFIQRGLDQVIHDAALQKLPLILALDRSGFVGEDGETHQGLFDIALLRPVPGIRILCPADAGELGLMLDWALGRSNLSGGPIVIRYPKDRSPAEIPAFSQPLVEGRGSWIRSGKAGEEVSVCLAFTGGLYREVVWAAGLLDKMGLGVDCYNLRFLKPVDEDYLAAVMDRYALTLFVEEGIREGGFGEYALALARRRNCRGKVLALAAEGNFAGLGTRQELLRVNRLDGEGIADYALTGISVRRRAERIGK